MAALTLVTATGACSGSPNTSSHTPELSSGPPAARSDMRPAPTPALGTAPHPTSSASTSAAGRPAPTALAAAPSVSPAELSTSVFDGRVLATGSGTETFCVTTRFDPTENAQSIWLDLVRCSYTEDEVGIYYLDHGQPNRSQAIEAFGERIGTCLESPTLLPMIAWPPSTDTLDVDAWQATFRVQGHSLRAIIDGRQQNLDLPAGHRPESLHGAAGGAFVVIRTAGMIDGHPTSACHTLALTP